jgi:hypothetical protein
MDKQLEDQGGDRERAVIVARRSELNHMDPCFRFPADELKDLFDGATMVEAMLVALEHMQINFVTVSVSGLRKFRRNVISFPQDLVSFAARHGFLKQYRVGDRVDSVRGPGRDLQRETKKGVTCTKEERERHAVTAAGELVYPARVRDINADGTLVLDYDHGGDGVELPEHVTARLVMPWNPKDVPLHMMLRRNIGHGRVLEGLQVRWHYVARLLRALCAFPRNGYGPWRLGGSEQEPMHKFYDPKLFDVLSEEEMKEKYAPKVSDHGGILSESEVAGLERPEAVKRAVDVSCVEHFAAAGFSVTFNGPEGEVLGENEGGEGEMVVEEDVFRRWLELSENRIGSAVARWWASEEPCEEGALDGVKGADDDTHVEFFARIKSAIAAEEKDSRGDKEGAVQFGALFRWLQGRMGESLGLADVDCSEVLADQLLHELSIVAELSQRFDDRGCMEEPIDRADDDEEAIRTAERLVYGWPSKAAEPTGVSGLGRFVKSHPLDFPMGVGDLHEERPLKVSVEDWVQHLLRYRTGHFVGGMRGQRVVWAMVNTLLLGEARGRGFGVYRNVLRRVGLGLQGGAVLTKARLRDMLRSEDSMRVLVNQLMTVGRDVRSTPMQWACEGKKLDATVKHLSWLPPWVEPAEDGEPAPGRRFLKEAEDWGAASNEMGHGRFPSVWWTLNCKYNAAYDLHRLNVRSKSALAAVDTASDAHKEERFLFTRDAPDLVAFMLSLRTGLHMWMVMPSVVPHSSEHPFLAMARFETGANGNPHNHGFSVGTPGPVMGRVRADVEGPGDEQPDLVEADEQKCRTFLFRVVGQVDVERGVPGAELLQEWISLAGSGLKGGQDAGDEGDGDDEGEKEVDQAYASVVLGRVLDAMLLENLLKSDGAGVEVPVLERVYRKGDDVQRTAAAEVVDAGRPGRQGCRTVRKECLEPVFEPSGILKEKDAGVDLQSDLEKGAMSSLATWFRSGIHAIPQMGGPAICGMKRLALTTWNATKMALARRIPQPRRRLFETWMLGGLSVCG